jgi:hypothetical protein
VPRRAGGDRILDPSVRAIHLPIHAMLVRSRPSRSDTYATMQLMQQKGSSTASAALEVDG